MAGRNVLSRLLPVCLSCKKRGHDRNRILISLNPIQSRTWFFGGPLKVTLLDCSTASKIQEILNQNCFQLYSCYLRPGNVTEGRIWPILFRIRADSQHFILSLAELNISNACSNCCAELNLTPRCAGVNMLDPRTHFWVDLTYSDSCYWKITLGLGLVWVYVFTYISTEQYLQLFKHLRSPSSSLHLLVTMILGQQQAVK